MSPTLMVDCLFNPLLPTAQGTLPWQPILGSQLAKSDYSPLYRHTDTLPAYFAPFIEGEVKATKDQES